jgi:hypothetical protein
MMWSMLVSPFVLFRNLGAGFEAIAVITCLKNVAAVGEPIEQGRGHLCVHCPAGASGRRCRERPKTVAHSLKLRLVVMITLVRS